MHVAFLSAERHSVRRARMSLAETGQELGSRGAKECATNERQRRVEMGNGKRRALARDGGCGGTSARVIHRGVRSHRATGAGRGREGRWTRINIGAGAWATEGDKGLRGEQAVHMILFTAAGILIRS